MKGQTIESRIDSALLYLDSKIEGGLVPEFHQLAHGPSQAWTTACVGSTLAEFNKAPQILTDVVLGLQHSNGGWSYNNLVPADSDSTARVLQFLRKIHYSDNGVIQAAELFIKNHQNPDGGISTYKDTDLIKFKYPSIVGWVESHPCVTAVVLNQVTDEEVITKGSKFLSEHIKSNGPISYWWRTPLYVSYEVSQGVNYQPSQIDPVELSLDLLLKAGQGVSDSQELATLTSLQNEDGSFIPNGQFRIPRPHQRLTDITGTEEVVTDNRGILSTCAAVVAMQRQVKLLAA